MRGKLNPFLMIFFSRRRVSIYYQQRIRFQSYWIHKGALGKPPLLILSSAVETRQKEKNNMEKDDGKGMKKSFWRKRKYENYDEEYFHLSLKNDFPIFHFTSLQTYIEVVAEGEEEEEAKHNIRSLSSTPCRTFQPSEPHLITFKPYFVLFLIRFKSH